MYHVVVRSEVEYARTVFCLSEAALLRACRRASCTPRPLLPIQLKGRRTAALVLTYRIQVRVDVFTVATKMRLRVVHSSVTASVVGFRPNRFRRKRGGQVPWRRVARGRPRVVARLTADAGLRHLVRGTAGIRA